ncbi:hypothetical protein ABK040_010802 [Willaertia magna]
MDYSYSSPVGTPTSPNNYTSPNAIQTPGAYSSPYTTPINTPHQHFSPVNQMSVTTPGVVNSPALTTPGGLGITTQSPGVTTPNPFNSPTFQPQESIQTQQQSSINTASSSNKQRTSNTTVTYLCGHCSTANAIKPGDSIRCRQCGYRIFYKQRTTRKIQFEAR